jgi:hypothetical protein
LLLRFRLTSFGGFEKTRHVAHPATDHKLYRANWRV